MRSSVGENTLWVPSSEEDKERVRRQMNRLLETSHFRNSKRYPPLFRFIVEETLAGRGEFLKERLLGIHVFGRPADYDTASDPIVRVTIAEIRKRIAQYYHEDAHESEMRIELSPGRYEPEFRPRKEHDSDRPPPVQAGLSDLPATLRSLPELPPVIAAELVGRKRRVFPFRYAVVALVLVLACAAYPLSRWSQTSSIDGFWGPLFATHQTISFCLPNGAGRFRGFAGFSQQSAPTPLPAQINTPAAGQTQTFLDHESLGENVVFSDALATLRISNLVAVHNRETRFRLNVSTSLDDLRQGPSILVGGMDNEWTLRAIAPLRFHFAGSDEDTYWIQDAKDLTNKNWRLDLKKHYTSVTRDYAIIARIHDESTGQLEVIVAGIGMSGTAAAGEFLVDPHQLAELQRRVGPAFRERDFEAVLSTDVVNGIAGSPKILAVTSW